MLVTADKGRKEKPTVEARVPTRLSSAAFQLKASLLRLERRFQNLTSGPTRLARGTTETFPHLIACSVTLLRSDRRLEEHSLQNGKIDNLRIAARLLDRTLIASGEVFSFWRQVGRPSRRRGFVSGRMLQQGCILPATGGGLCQLSNALYDIALTAGCEIIERHAHSRIIPGSAAEYGRDATVAWNYVDLQFRSAQPLLLRVQLTANQLVVGLRSIEATKSSPQLAPETSDREIAVRSCGTCKETTCFRHETGLADVPGGTAFLLNELWPEFITYVRSKRDTRNSLYIPFNGTRWGVNRYRCDTSGFDKVTTATYSALRNSVALRRLGAQGAERRLAELHAAEAIARRYARELKPDSDTLCVAQSLLPFLWRNGDLGGRRFRVLMTSLPMVVLQERLDHAVRMFPRRATLFDFRAPKDLVELETEALAAADAIITPHEEIAAMFPDRIQMLEWQSPKKFVSSSECASHRIAFPGPTVARKGCYELRETARSLDLEVLPLGSELEGPNFWQGVRLAEVDRSNWLNGVSLVVQPAIVEQAPRRLLAALAAGVPVVATPACGLPRQPGLTLVPSCDSERLTAAVCNHFA